jgi:hypothetical protein
MRPGSVLAKAFKHLWDKLRVASPASSGVKACNIKKSSTHGKLGTSIPAWANVSLAVLNQTKDTNGTVKLIVED